MLQAITAVAATAKARCLSFSWSLLPVGFNDFLFSGRGLSFRVQAIALFLEARIHQRLTFLAPVVPSPEHLSSGISPSPP
jgi:hypothetical protein